MVAKPEESLPSSGDDTNEVEEMSITEEKRLDLANSAREALGQANGDTLMELLPPVGWADVATKHDLEQLRILIGKDFELLRLEINQRFQETNNAINSVRAELKSEIALQISELRAESGHTITSLRTEMGRGFVNADPAIGSLRDEMNQRFADSNHAIGSLRNEMNQRFADTDHAIDSLRLGMDGELRSLRTELALQISELRNELNRSLLKFFIGTTATTILTLLSGMYLTR